jgi:hypothetical protein
MNTLNVIANNLKLQMTISMLLREKKNWKKRKKERTFDFENELVKYPNQEFLLIFFL